MLCWLLLVFYSKSEHLPKISNLNRNMSILVKHCNTKKLILNYSYYKIFFKVTRNSSGKTIFQSSLMSQNFLMQHQWFPFIMSALHLSIDIYKSNGKILTLNKKRISCVSYGLWNIFQSKDQGSKLETAS